MYRVTITKTYPRDISLIRSIIFATSRAAYDYVIGTPIEDHVSYNIVRCS